MPGTDLFNAIGDALALHSTAESIDGVKTVVRNALQQMDQNARIRETHYFNHSLVPDFILSWPKGNKTVERDVYLRLDLGPDFIEDDLSSVGNTEPILLGLDRVDYTYTGDVVYSPETARTLVTDPLAIDSFASAPAATDFGGVFSSAVLKGGQGVITGDDADTLRGAAADAFEAARTHEPQPIAQAEEVMTPYLREEQAAGVFMFMRTLWEATGGNAVEFPLQTDLGGLDDAALRFVLQEGPRGDAKFWRSVGSFVTLRHLLDLYVGGAPNVWPFVAANLDRLMARNMVVSREDDVARESGSTWALLERALAYKGRNFTAYFAMRKSDVPTIQSVGATLSPLAFRERLGSAVADAVVLDTDGNTSITIESRSGDSVANDESIEALSQLSSARVRRASVQTETGKHLDCRFDELAAAGRTNASFSLLELIQDALPLLWPLLRGDRGDIASMMTFLEDATSRSVAELRRTSVGQFVAVDEAERPAPDQP